MLAKYDQAAAVCNVAMSQLVAVSIPGANVFQMCEFGDKAIVTALGQVFPGEKLAKGIAVPTSVSINNCLNNFSPIAATDKTALKAGDLVKVQLGAHIDGILAVISHTFIASPAPTAEAPATPTTGTKADAICAAHFATEAALRLMRPGHKGSEVALLIQKVAAEYGCNAVADSVTYSLDRYVLEGPHTFATRSDDRSDVNFETGEAYLLNVTISTGLGKCREEAEKPSIYRRDNDAKYQLKLQASRTLAAEVKKSFPTLPFNLRAVKDQKTARLGVSEMVKHGNLIPYPVLYEKNNQVIAQFKSTVLILPAIGETPARTLKLTAHALPFVSSEKSITDPEINALLAQPLTH
ncbi:MAG: M24 family metallopeptidase [archaeon]|nr:M24 family metallopeptidase [archaeon]